MDAIPTAQLNSAYPLRVLFVDDDLEQSKTLAKLLEKRISPAALEVFLADTVELGVSASHTLKPCIVFLDLQFPASNWEKTLLSVPHFYSQSKIIVVTQMDGAEVEMKARASGALAVFVKSKIPNIIEIITWVVANIGLNWKARQGLA